MYYCRSAWWSEYSTCNLPFLDNVTKISNGLRSWHSLPTKLYPPLWFRLLVKPCCLQKGKGLQIRTCSALQYVYDPAAGHRRLWKNDRRMLDRCFGFWDKEIKYSTDVWRGSLSTMTYFIHHPSYSVRSTNATMSPYALQCPKPQNSYSAPHVTDLLSSYTAHRTCNPKRWSWL